MKTTEINTDTSELKLAYVTKKQVVKFIANYYKRTKDTEEQFRKELNRVINEANLQGGMDNQRKFYLRVLENINQGK
jgi:hypothetical protein